MNWEAGVEHERGKDQEEQAAEQIEAAWESWEGMQQTSKLAGKKADGGEDHDGLQCEDDAQQRQLQLWWGVAWTHEGGQKGEKKDGNFGIGGVGEQSVEEIAFGDRGLGWGWFCFFGGVANGSHNRAADDIDAEPGEVATTEQFHGGIGRGRSSEECGGAEHSGGGMQQTAHSATDTEADCGTPASGESETDGGQHIGAG